ncbi:MAG: GAP family protein [Pseudomonadota bacterium]
MNQDLTLMLVLGAAAIDAVNPCAIGVILFLSSALLKVSSSRSLLIRLGLVYIGTVYVVYILSGLGLIWFQHFLISRGFAEIVGIAVGALVIILGLIEIKEFFWYGKGISLEIATRHKERITRMAERISLLGVFAIGAFVALVELPCTGGPYLAITAILAKSFDRQAFLYLLLYNFVFILPLLIILLMIYFGASTVKMKQWRQSRRKWMNLASGVLMLALGTLLVAYYRFGWY